MHTLKEASDKYTAETASRRVTLFEGKQWCLQDVPQLPAAKRSKKKSTAKAAATAEAAAEAAAAGDDIYIVPEDFDAAVLGQPDFSSMADAERTLADLFVKRWWDLREQVITSDDDRPPPALACLLCSSAVHPLCTTADTSLLLSSCIWSMVQ